MRDPFDPHFIYFLLIGGPSQRAIRGMASGTSGSMHNIPQVAFLEMRLEAPCESSEQRVVGGLFRNLDSLITLHQRKLDGGMVVRSIAVYLSLSCELRADGRMKTDNLLHVPAFLH